MKSGLVTVGMPVFNGERYLKEAINSILNQSYKNIELVISDNCSTDETQAICLDYSSKDPRVRYIRQIKNSTAVENFRLVLNSARGDYFMWASDDDLWSEYWIENLLVEVNLSKGIASFGCAIYINEFGERVNSIANNVNFNFLQKYKIFRRLKFIFTPHIDGKMILLYSIFPCELLRFVANEELLVPEYKGQDLFLVFKLLDHIQIKFSKKSYLYKRNHANSDSYRLQINKITKNSIKNRLLSLMPFLYPIKPLLYPLFFKDYWCRMKLNEKLLLVMMFPYYFGSYSFISIKKYIKWKYS